MGFDTCLVDIDTTLTYQDTLDLETGYLVLFFGRGKRNDVHISTGFRAIDPMKIGPPLFYVKFKALRGSTTNEFKSGYLCITFKN
jgi:hypothetical protein